MFFIHAMTDYMNELTKKHRAKRTRVWLIERRGPWARLRKKNTWKLVYEFDRLASARRALDDIVGMNGTWWNEYRVRRTDRVAL